MKRILGYLRVYGQEFPLQAGALVSLLMGVLIYFNYTTGIEKHLMDSTTGLRLTGFFCLYVFVFGGAWLLHFCFSRDHTPPPRSFYLLLLASCLIFAIKVSADDITRLITAVITPPWDRYWFLTLNWPLKCALVLLLIAGVWRLGRFEGPVAGMQGKGFGVKPYFILLLLMVPLVLLAGTQADFQHTYPKVKRIDFIDYEVIAAWPYKLLYELSYGVDFLTIETFFRGFLVLAFARYAGKGAILPMAAFYCCIHFGKPLFECITSYFGGLILGVVVYHSRSIWGGLIVHLGIAWLMELAGWLFAK